MESPNFHLEGVLREKEDLKDFEGPLSLILMLLKKNKIEIRDIKISDILDQYLDYLREMQEMDLEIASEFVQMASYLVFIKAKTLLSGGDEEVSELEMLIESLEQLKARDTLLSVREVTGNMLEAYKTGSLFGVKPPEVLPKISEEYRYSHTGVELLEALKRVFTVPEKADNLQALNRAIPSREVYSVKNKSRELLSRLKLRDMSLRSLYSECGSRSEIIATFLAVLELCSIGSVVVSVSRSGDDYEIGFTGGDVDEILKNIED